MNVLYTVTEIAFGETVLPFDTIYASLPAAFADCEDCIRARFTVEEEAADNAKPAEERFKLTLAPDAYAEKLWCAFDDETGAQFWIKECKLPEASE